jgi:uncharacterized protein (TIGR03118 family)
MKNFKLLITLFAMISSSSLLMGQTGYMQTNLAANTAGVANNTDPQLLNPWGISFSPGSTFWISNNNGGTSTTYDAAGVKQSITVTIPSARNNPCNPGCPTGTVANTSTDFNGGTFLFVTEDGLVANWTGNPSAVVAVDNSAQGAVYKGMALLNTSSGNFLLAANFNSGHIDVFDHNFNPVSLAGTFTDPNLPAGFAPHAVHIVGNQVYVAYAVQNSTKQDPTFGAGKGLVDIFDETGAFVKTFASDANLNAPWGVVQTPASFGDFSNDILVGNFGDGTINAYDSTGKFLGKLTDSAKNNIVNPGLWDMVFGAGGVGDPNTMYFTAGRSTGGLFATLVPASTATAGNFSLSLSAQSATITPGQSAMLKVSAAAVGGFNGQITLTCSSLTGLTCAFSPNVIFPGSSSSSTLTVAAASTPPSTGYGVPASMAWLPFSGVGAMGMLFANRRNRKPVAKTLGQKLAIGSLGVLIVCILFAIGCGGGSSNSATTSPASSKVTLMVTGTSGAISHTTPVTLTIQ